MTTATQNYSRPLTVLTSLFFMWGLITSLNDILVPHMKALFDLSYVQAALIQFSFFTAYFVMSFPAGRLVEKAGYQRGIMIGLAIAGLGCLLFYPAAAAKSYPFFLAALFILASGITLLQVAANPYVTLLGKPDTASSRLNLTQAFNSLGTALGPLFGSLLILSPAVKEAGSVQTPYLLLAGALFALAVLIGQCKLPGGKETAATDDAIQVRSGGSVWQYRHLVLGALGIFVYVGGEVGVGSFLVSLLGQPHIAGLAPEVAGKYLALYWSGAMVGRFLGGALMRKIAPGRMLAFNAAAVALLIGVAMLAGGKTAMWALIAIGLFNSIMFPTIFSLALEGLGKFTGTGSGMLCMAIVGGALLPLLQALLADRIGLLYSFLVPLLCYLYILFYGLHGHKPVLAGAKLALRKA